MTITTKNLLRPKVKIVDEIIESLRQGIASGDLKHGAQLPTEKELAQLYNVSQPTIREAIRALTTLGLIEVQHGRGAYVKGSGNYAMALAFQTLLQLENVSIIETLDVRQTLGRESVKIAATIANDEDISNIEKALNKLDHIGTAKNVDDVIRPIIEFQSCISAACHNPLLHSIETFLVTLLLEIQVKAFGKRGASFWRTRAAEYQDDRRQIYTAISKHSPKEASIAMDRYFDNQRQSFIKNDKISELKLSDPRLIQTVADMMQEIKLR